MLRTELCEMLGIKYPVIQGGMAPWTTEELSVAAANAGALGIVSSIGLGMKQSPPVAVKDDAAWEQKSPYELLRSMLHWVARQTAEKRGVFGVNVPLAQEFGDFVGELIRAINDSRKEDQDLAERLKVIITSAGNPAPWRDLIKESGALWFHVVPSVSHALKAERAGADLVIASGREGGGHVAFEPVHTMVLLPAVVRAVDLPVVGAGGFCDGAGLAAALSLGAIGIQMGTRFIATQDSGFTPIWKQKILESDEKGSLVGISIFGPARYLRNKVSIKLNQLFKQGYQEGYEEAVKLEMRGLRLLREDEDPDNSVFLGGEVAGRIDQMPSVDALLKQISAEAERVIQGLSGLVAEE
jgi:enoyl-[acyl-carrier protein] reductase II